MIALSLSNSVTDIGALAAFAALLGIAILSLLVFSQAREIKRLREWAGRAPERAAEMEQRISANAAARVRGAGPTPSPSASRVVPRKTPLVSAPVSTAVNATVSAVVPAGEQQPASAAAAQTPAAQTPAAQTPAAEPPAVPAAPAGSAQTPAVVAAETPALLGSPPAAPAEQAGESLAPSVAAQSAVEGKQAEQPAAPAPATAAARAASDAARPAFPPSPAAPAPPGTAPSMSSSKQAARPPAVASSRGMPSRALRTPAPAPAAQEARSPVPGASLGGAARGAAGGGARTGVPVGAGARAATAPVGEGPKYFKRERSPMRATALIVGLVVAAVVVLVLAVSVLKGGGSKTHSTQESVVTSNQSANTHRSASHSVAAKPAETAVVVLNGTSTAGLAHHLAADLQQSGYSQAAALDGVPPGTHATTVVQYTPGHRADAQGVAKALDVTHVQAIESSTSSLTGAATVVVLAGADQASQLGGGGAHSKGEPAGGAPTAAEATGEGAAGSGQ